MKTKLLKLALTAAGMATVTVAQAQPVPAPTAPPPAPAPTATATTDPNAPPPPATPDAPPPAPTSTSTQAPLAPPPGTPAQGDPNAPPAPPPVAPTPPPVAPAPPPAVTAPPPAPAPPPAAEPPPPEKTAAQKFLARFAGSLLFWSHQATVSTFGLKSSENYAEGFNGVISGDADVYIQSLTFLPGAFLYRDDRHAVRLSTSISVTTELTNADNTTYKLQPDINNIPLTLSDNIQIAGWGAGGGASAAAVARDPTLAGAVEYRTQALLAASLLFPTSRTFASGGMLLGASLSAGLRQQIKLLGSNSDYLPNVTVIAREVWTHQFWRSKTPIDDDLQRTRQDYAGNAQVDNQLRGGANSENRLTHDFRLQLPITGDLQFSALFQVINDFPHHFDGTNCDVLLGTGCVDLDKSETKMRALTQFDLSVYYQITDELALDVGYNNFNTQLGENGSYRNPLLSPSSSFYADIYVFPEAFIQRLIAPAKPKNQVGRR